ncbi:MAG: GNAT family N-acetyltransferase [Marmoricola sp.]
MTATSCRLAWPQDAGPIADVQIAAWRRSYAGILPDEVLAGLDRASLVSAWQEEIARPGEARQRILVALAENDVVGYVLTAPAADPDCDPATDGEIDDLTVHSEHESSGHGSRLLHAAIDTLRADRFERAVVWLNSTDDVRRAFLTASGWAADGAHRTLDLNDDGKVLVHQVRLHTDLSVTAP